VRGDTLDVQNVRRGLRSIWDRLRISIIVMHRRSSKGLSRATNEYRDVDVVDNINWDWSSNRDGDRDRHVHSLRVSNNSGHGNRHGDGHLHGDRSWHSLLDNDIIWLRNFDGDGARNTDLLVDCNRLRHSNGLDFLDGDWHRAVLDDSVRCVHVVLSGLDDFDRHRHLDLLYHIFDDSVGLWDSNLLRNGLRLVDRDIDLVRDNLIDRHNYLNGIWYLHLLDSLHWLRHIDGLCLCDFDRVRNIHRNVDGDRNCIRSGDLDGLRYFDCHRDVVRTRNPACHLVWDNNLVWHSDFLWHRYLDGDRHIHRHCVGDVDSHWHSHRDRDGNSHGHLDGHRHSDRHGYRYLHVHWHSLRNLDRYGHSHGDRDGNSHGHLNGHRHSDRHGHRHLHVHLDGLRNLDLHGHLDRNWNRDVLNLRDRTRDIDLNGVRSVDWDHHVD
jgi:hypothetical protein